MLFNVSPLFKIDFYKAGHYAQYPKNTVEIFSNLTPRSSRTDANYVIFFGLQAILKEIHEDWQKNFFDLDITELLEEYKLFMDKTIYPDSVSVDHIKAVHELGYLPLEIMALPEGTKVPIGVPVFTIVNNCPEAYWLVNYLETKLSNAIWKAVTSATTAFQYRQKFEEVAKTTGANTGFIPFAGHDFSYRGMSGDEDAIMSGMAHLTCFCGTDTVPAIHAAKHYYGADWKTELVGCSVVATEHSVMCAGGMEDEFGTFERLMDDFIAAPFLSIVSDTWDYWKVITDYLPRLKDKIMDRSGRIVIRPDSGDPVEIICGKDVIEDEDLCIEALESYFEQYYWDNDADVDNQFIEYLCKIEDIYYKVTCTASYITERGGYTDNKYDCLDEVKVTYSPVTNLDEIAIIKGTFQCLWDTFGGTTNEKGFKVLNPHIGVIYGDSITLDRQKQILARLEDKGFTADNLVLGIGSFTYEYVTRDTYGMALKATNAVIGIEGVDEKCLPIFKDPKTNSGGFTNKSAKGYLKVIEVDGVLKLKDEVNGEEMYMDDNKMEIVYNNGDFMRTHTLSEIRERINSYL